MIQLLNETQGKMESLLKEVEEKLSQNVSKVAQIKENADKIEGNQFEVEQLKAKTQKNETLSLNENTKLRQKIDDLENRMRRKNLIISGIEESDSETWADSESKVKKLFTDTLKINVNIERAHRVGRKMPKKTRPIIVLLTSFKEKLEVYRSAHLLKGKQIYINDDVSKEIRDQRAELIKFAKANFANDRFKIRYNKLYIGTRTFVTGHVGVHELL